MKENYGKGDYSTDFLVHEDDNVKVFAKDLKAEGALTVLLKAGLVPSKSEARRAVQQGGVSVDGEKVTDTYKAYTAEDFAGEGIVIKKGKKHFRKIVM